MEGVLDVRTRSYSPLVIWVAMALPIAMSPVALYLSITAVLPLRNPACSSACIIPATPSSNTGLFACCRMAILTILRASGLRRCTSDRTRTVEVSAISEMPSERRFRGAHIQVT